MDFSRYGLPATLVRALSGMLSLPELHEVMLDHAFLAKENICVRLEAGAGREEIILLPALAWLHESDAEGGIRGNVLFIAARAELARLACDAARRLAGDSDIRIRLIEEDDDAFTTIHDRNPAPNSVLISETEPLSRCMVAGTLPAILKEIRSGRLNGPSFTFILVDGLDAISEFQAEGIRELRSRLPPTWEARAILACSRMSSRVRILARDLAENPAELVIDETIHRRRGVRSETFHIDTEAKVRFILGLRDRGLPPSTLVFCNLRDTAGSLVRRLAANGVVCEQIAVALPPHRMKAVMAKFLSGAIAVLVVTDEGATGFDAGSCSLVINFDLPLDPEIYIRRTRLLDARNPDSRVINLACERYVYGLPAIESELGFSLNAVDVPEGLLADGEKPSSPANPVPGGGSYGRPIPQREDRAARRGIPQEAAPVIMMSVAEAAGRMTARQVREDQNRPAAGKKSADTARVSPGAAIEPVSASTRPASRRSAVRQPLSAHRPVQDRSGSLRSVARSSPSPRPATADVDPYAMTMEERLRGYREKYGERPADKPPAPLSVKAPSPQIQEAQSARAELRVDSDPSLPKNDRFDSDAGKRRGILGRIVNFFRKT